MHAEVIVHQWPSVALAAGGSTACATKNFVQTSVGEVNDKVGLARPSLEETQERTRRTKRRSARSTRRRRRPRGGRQAGQRRRDGGQQRGDRRRAAARRPTPRPTRSTRPPKRLVYEVVLSEDQGNFKFGKTDLPDEAKAKIDEMVAAAQGRPEGRLLRDRRPHRQRRRRRRSTRSIGLERAEAVKRYLYEQHQIPLHKMNVISYGEDKPVAPNKTKDGRAQNRRVVIRVLGLARSFVPLDSSPIHNAAVDIPGCPPPRRISRRRTPDCTEQRSDSDLADATLIDCISLLDDIDPPGREFEGTSELRPLVRLRRSGREDRVGHCARGREAGDAVRGFPDVASCDMPCHVRCITRALPSRRSTLTPDVVRLALAQEVHDRAAQRVPLTGLAGDADVERRRIHDTSTTAPRGRAGRVNPTTRVSSHRAGADGRPSTATVATSAAGSTGFDRCT